MFSNKLIAWYLENQRDLPWRKTKNPYYVWLSEIMLQQTRIEQGLPYYLKFTEAYPTIFDLAKASEDEVLKMWQGLGYYSRARNLHYTAKYIANELNGIFPETFEELVKLKGVGDYTASAIASFCYGEVQPVVDGNVYRVLSRYIGIHTPINESSSLKKFKAVAHEFIPKDNPADFNQAIMEYGATVCTPKNSGCESCTFSASCYAFNNNEVSELPIKIKKQKIRKRYFNYLVYLSENNETILEKRTGKGIWENLYQFPLIETNELATIKNIKAAINDDTDSSISLFNEHPVVHKLSHQHLITQFWIVSTTTIVGEKVSVSQLSNYPVPILIQNFIEAFKF